MAQPNYPTVYEVASSREQLAMPWVGHSKDSLARYNSVSMVIGESPIGLAENANMQLAEKEFEKLFTYGTLREGEVQLATFGRRLEGMPDVLPGYRLVMIRIEDQDFVAKSGTADHRNIQFTGVLSDYVEGIVFAVTKEELEHSDAYEPVGYGRVLVRLKSGINAWVYLNMTQ